MKRLISAVSATPLERRLLACVLGLFIAIAFVRAWQFYRFPGLPGLYAKDLGVNFIISEYMRHTIHSPRDFVDMLGWSAWWDQPFFFYNSYLSYIAIVPLADLLRSSWASIKLLEITQTVLACLGTYWLLRLFDRPRVWALAAGVIYAAVPAVVFMPRGNLDLGWPTVLAPMCLVGGIRLIRRYGARALPLCGVLCSLVGLAALEYGIFVSAPTFVILAAYALRRRQLATWAAFTLLGTGTMALFGAYFLIPTLSNHLFSDSAVRTATLAHGDFVAYYSENLVSAMALILRESLLSPIALYNATPQLPIAMIGGVVLWSLCAVGLSRLAQSILRGPFGVISAITVAVLMFLAVSSLLPGGAALWHLFESVPLLNQMRTPDRFITLPTLALVICAVEGLRAIVENTPGQQATGAVLAALVLSAFFYVAGAQQVWTNQQDYGSEEPALQTVNRLVSRIGPRTAALALLNGGSTGDYPSYGVPTATLTGLWEFAARYAQDGVAMTGLLPRLGTRSVITTPNWAAADDEGYPSFGGLLTGQRGAHLVFRSPQNVRIYTLSADRTIASTHIACLQGGPGLLDYLLALPPLRHVDLTAVDASCSLAVSSDRDVEDATLPTARWSAAGSILCPRCGRAKDVDFLFYPGRVLIRQPWYRNSIDGDDPIFDPQGAAILVTNTQVVLAPRGLTANSRLALRIASHAYATLSFVCGAQERALRLLPFSGFRWIDVPITNPAHCSRIYMSTSVDATQPLDVSTFSAQVALDGAAVFHQTASKLAARKPVIVAFATDHFGPTAERGFLSQTAFSTTVPRRQMRMRWNGPTVEAIITASIKGYRYGASEIRLSAGGEHVVCCAEEQSPQPAVARYVILRAVLQRGGGIMASISGDPGVTITGLQAVALKGSVALQDASNSLVSGDLDFSSGPFTLAQLRIMSGFGDTALSTSGLTGGPGSTFETSIPATLASNTLVVGFVGVTGPGSARASLECATRSAFLSISASSGGALAIDPNGSGCKLRVRFRKRLTIGRIFFEIARTAIFGERMVWIPRGVYRVTVYSRKLLPLAGGTLVVDGRRVDRRATMLIDSDGAHRVALLGIPSSSAFIAFVPAALVSSGAKPIRFRQTASLRYMLDVPAQTDVKLAHLDDGNWALKGNRGTVFGVPCDIVATCYFRVPPGTYQIAHRLPRPVLEGLLVTLLTLLVALGSLAIRSQRSPAGGG